jgi:uncharacterized coiled-coil protein SlyX
MSVERIEELTRALVATSTTITLQNIELKARIADLETRLADALDEVYDLRRKIGELENVNDELRQMKGKGSMR